ncbi:alpha/beta hydrolase [uncultured Nitratireductor sp.]|uniref:alpha/beta fold hydrolase n=1 Tax=uncultured Nitratireductor sp. TaxID=520953 RepID=UPI0025ED7582|nr:alpha/beta hydrolase [uncultured Nitratireductor sp.]
MEFAQAAGDWRTGEVDHGRGTRTNLGEFSLNSLHLDCTEAELPPLVFIHGASATLLDPLFCFRTALEGRARLLFVDRPGHGRSDKGPEATVLPDGQAEAIARLMKAKGIARAIIVGHSYGGAVAAAMALNQPESVLGLVLLAPALYPWPGGIAWYYDAARHRTFGGLFSRLVVPLAGRLTMRKAVRSVFAPNPTPENYVEATVVREAIEPGAFRHNAREIGALHAWTERNRERYGAIEAPTVIITGTRDDVVSPDIHSRQLARDLPDARLLCVRGLGHKPDYHARDLVIAAIEKMSGQPRDLEATKRAVEARLTRSERATANTAKA